MQGSILRFFALSILCAGGAFGQQGTFAQIAYGGSWQTTFTLLNLSSTNLASVTFSFFGDNGSPLNAPIQGFGNASSYTFTIPANGAQNVVLSSSDSTTTQGWASMSVASGIVRGQGSFRFLLPGGAISEAVVPLSISGLGACIISFPVAPGSTPVIQVPFDNTTGQYVTALAIANTSNTPLAVPIEFDDQSNNQLVSDTLNLTVNQHMAFLFPQRYPALSGKKGILRIRESSASVSVLGLLANATNAITTIIPVTQ
jgi:hypothetical protein